MKRTAQHWHTLIAFTNVVLRDGWTYPERLEPDFEGDYRWRGLGDEGVQVISRLATKFEVQWFDDATRTWETVRESPFQTERDAIAFVAERRAAA